MPANRSEAPGEGRKSFLLRIDPELWRELDSWSRDELRSVNGQIEYLLRQAVQRRRQGSPPPEDTAARGARSGAK